MYQLLKRTVRGLQTYQRKLWSETVETLQVRLEHGDMLQKTVRGWGVETCYMRLVAITAITYLQTNDSTPTTNDRGPSVAQQVPKGLMSLMGCRLGTR